MRDPASSVVGTTLAGLLTVPAIAAAAVAWGAAPERAPRVAAPTFARASVLFPTDPAGNILAVTEQYTIRWTSDGHGGIDSAVVTGTATGQATQRVRILAPITFPRTVALTWQSAPPGSSVTTQACVFLVRRAVKSATVCSPTRAYPTPDVALPPPTIDTLAGFELILAPNPRWTRLAPSQPTSKVCPVMRMFDGTRTLRARDLADCGGVDRVKDELAKSPRTSNPAIQARADRACLDFKIVPIAPTPTTADGGTITPSGCDRVIAVGGNGQTLSGTTSVR